MTTMRSVIRLRNWLASKLAVDEEPRMEPKEPGPQHGAHESGSSAHGKDVEDPYSPDPRVCGLTDAVKGGWLNSSTGELFSGFPLGPADTLLDVGCGEGLAVSFASGRECPVIYCDLDLEKMRNLRSHLEDRGVRWQAPLVASGDRLPLADASVNRIVCTEVLEHAEDPARLLSEMVRVGTDDALYLISIPDADGERLQIGIAPDLYFQAPNHIRIIDNEEFERLVTESGLEIVSRGQGGFFWLIWMCFFWASGTYSQSDAEAVMDRIQPPYHPLLEQWTLTWRRFLHMPGSEKLHAALNARMPKSRLVVARKMNQQD
jgi:SAM-dependent methyltransferase